MFPDPLLTSNVYCEGHLDEIIHHAVAPFWREFRQIDPDRLCYLWLVRYNKGGEHLKIRLHGPETQRPLLQRLLTAAVEPYLAKAGGPKERIQASRRADVPPMDAEDQVEADHPDRTFLWTSYRRSHISLGGKPFLLDDRYAALLTRCLGSACERVLAALELDQRGLFPTNLRQTALLTGLIAGLAGLGFPAQKRADYLAYHRDWLLRFKLLRNGGDPLKARKLLEHFDAQAAAMESSLIRLRDMAEMEWSVSEEGGLNGPASEWRTSLADLLGFVSPFSEDPDYHLDPFASDPVFSPIFKVFHGFANQLGLHVMDEGFTHHLLLRASEAREPSQP